MKLPTNYLQNLTITKYREYLKLLPNMKQENTKVITMLIFTFLALSFLGIFAINPTLVTIIDLHKQLQESEYVHQQLTTKNANLSNLQQQYTNLSDELPFLYDAIPQAPQVPKVIGQVEALAEQTNVKIISINLSPVILSDPDQPEGIKTHSSFTFTLEATGEYEDMLNFATALTDFDRIVTIDSVSFLKDDQNNKLTLGVKGREYFKK